MRRLYKPKFGDVCDKHLCINQAIYTFDMGLDVYVCLEHFDDYEAQHPNQRHTQPLILTDQETILILQRQIAHLKARNDDRKITLDEHQEFTLDRWTKRQTGTSLDPEMIRVIHNKTGLSIQAETRLFKSAIQARTFMENQLRVMVADLNSSYIPKRHRKARRDGNYFIYQYENATSDYEILEMLTEEMFFYLRDNPHANRDIPPDGPPSVAVQALRKLRNA